MMTDGSVIRMGEALADALRRFGVGDAVIALERLAPLYDEDVVFHDPLQTLHGRTAFLAMNERVIKRARRVSFRVGDIAATADVAFVSWTMTYEPHTGATIVFEGVTRARVRDSKIVEQRDYWDLLSSVASSRPLFATLHRTLATRLG